MTETANGRTLGEVGALARRELASRVRATYIRERIEALERLGRSAKYTPGPYWDGGLYKKRGADLGSAATKRKNFWEQAARWFTEHNLNYEEVIQTIFKSYRPQYPEPNQIIGLRPLQLCRRQEEYQKQVIITGFETQKEAARQKLFFSCEMGMTNAEAWSAMLQDTTLPISALFRYCLAVSENYQSFARRFHDAALLQYLGNRAVYDAVWKKWIPAAFRREADAWRQAIIKT